MDDNERLTALQDELADALRGEVKFDPYTRTLYSTDASNFQIEPLGVAFPRHTDELQAIVEVADRHDVPVIVRGSGSSMAGQTLGRGLVVDCTRYLDNILAFDPEAGTVTVTSWAEKISRSRRAPQASRMFR